MEIINAIVAVMSKMGIEYLIAEFGSIGLLLLVYFNQRKNSKLMQKLLDKFEKNWDELDPLHLYSKINRLEDNLDNHQNEEVRQLHEIDNMVNRIDTKLSMSVRTYNRRHSDLVHRAEEEDCE